MSPTPPADDIDPVDDAVADDELDRELAAADGVLSEQLRALLDPGGDLRRRTADDVDRSLRSTDTLGAALELLSVGWWTVRTVLTDDHRPADRGPEGR
jgi:hypothetical protein